MKKLFSLVAVTSLLMLVACDDDDPVVNEPQLSVKVIESNEASVKIQVKTENAEQTSLLFQAKSDAEPTMAQIITEGQTFKSELDTVLVYDHLQSSSEYRLNVMAMNSEYHIAKSVEASTSVAYDMQINMTNAIGWYYGDYQKTNNGYYMLALGDSRAELGETGLPTAVGQKIIHLYLGGQKSKDSHHAVIPDGHYVLSDGYGDSSVNLYNSRIMECTGISEETGVQGVQYSFYDGFVDVKSTGENKYKIVVDMFVNDGKNTRIRSVYNGKLPLINNDPASYNPLTDNKLDIKMKSGSGNYIPSKTYGTYTLVIYNVSTTPDGFINGAGDLVNVTFMTNPARPMNLEKATGTYTIVPGSATDAFTPGKAMAGEYIETYGQYMPIGTFYQLYDENAAVTELGMAKEGTIKVEYKDSKVYLDIEFVTIEGAKVSTKYAVDEAAVFDYSDYYPEAAAFMYKMGMVNLRDITKPRCMIF